MYGVFKNSGTRKARCFHVSLENRPQTWRVPATKGRPTLKKNDGFQLVARLELYTYVWRKGECQRDVAGDVLHAKTLSGAHH